MYDNCMIICIITMYVNSYKKKTIFFSKTWTTKLILWLTRRRLRYKMSNLSLSLSLRFESLLIIQISKLEGRPKGHKTKAIFVLRSPAQVWCCNSCIIVGNFRKTKWTKYEQFQFAYLESAVIFPCFVNLILEYLT